MADLSTHEKFLRGEPLTEDLAALRTGLDPRSTPRPAPVERRSYGDLERELTRPERLDLKEFWEMPGRKLYQQMAEKAVLFHQKRAISLSQDDPFGNRDEVATAWAYVKIYRRVIAELDVMVTAELAELENEQ